MFKAVRGENERDKDSSGVLLVGYEEGQVANMMASSVFFGIVWDKGGKKEFNEIVGNRYKD
ncbi:hypothetical protein [Bacteroides acidifaciens]|uniref:hypothetical protein n=1 Tax=Bacteroides acidifaciens TaxID=85831 RepID=UPI003F692ACD